MQIQAGQHHIFRPSAGKRGVAGGGGGGRVSQSRPTNKSPTKSQVMSPNGTQRHDLVFHELAQGIERRLMQVFLFFKTTNPLGFAVCG